MSVKFSDANREKMKRVAEKLLGSCSSVDDVLQEVFGDEELTLTDFDAELLRELDDMTMECVVCNWWCELHELDDDQVCDDCR